MAASTGSECPYHPTHLLRFTLCLFLCHPSPTLINRGVCEQRGGIHSNAPHLQLLSCRKSGAALFPWSTLIKSNFVLCGTKEELRRCQLPVFGLGISISTTRVGSNHSKHHVCAGSTCAVDEAEYSVIVKMEVSTPQTNRMPNYSAPAAMEPPLARSPMLPNAPVGDVWPLHTQARAHRTCVGGCQCQTVTKTTSSRRLIVSHRGNVDASRLYNKGGLTFTALAVTRHRSPESRSCVDP